MGMVMVLLLIFLAAGVCVERVDRWVMMGLSTAIALVLILTYARF
jgi:hypothetical protein